MAMTTTTTPKKKSENRVTIQVETHSAAVQTYPPPQHDKILKPIANETAVTTSPFKNFLEKTWVGFLVALFLASLALSVVSLTRTSSDWLVSSQDHSESRVGWSKGCVDRVRQDGNEQTVLPCTSTDSVESLETIINSSAGTLGQTILIVSLLIWILPVVIVLGSSWFEATRGTCCHGFSIALLWAIGGLALIAIGPLFKCVVNDRQNSNQTMRWSVTCTTDSYQEIPVCTDVTSLSKCPLKCQFYDEEEEDGFCTGFSHCTLHEREATCDEDGIGCEMQMGWALYASLISSLLMVLMAILLAIGSWTVSQSL